MTAAIQIPLPLPVLPDTWAGGDQNFKVVSSLSRPIDRAIEPVGPYFLAHARRKRYKRTFSEDERIQAQQNVKKMEDDDDGEISEEEDPLMLSRDAKDWKVCYLLSLSLHYHSTNRVILTMSTLGSRPLRCSRPLQVPLQSD